MAKDNCTSKTDSHPLSELAKQIDNLTSEQLLERIHLLEQEKKILKTLLSQVRRRDRQRERDKRAGLG